MDHIENKLKNEVDEISRKYYKLKDDMNKFYGVKYELETLLKNYNKKLKSDEKDVIIASIQCRSKYCDSPNCDNDCLKCCDARNGRNEPLKCLFYPYPIDFADDVFKYLETIAKTKYNRTFVIKHNISHESINFLRVNTIDEYDIVFSKNIQIE